MNNKFSMKEKAMYLIAAIFIIYMLSLKYLVDDFFNLKDSTEKNKTTIMRKNN